MHRDALYKHYLPPGAWPIPGTVHGKHNIIQSLSRFLHDFHVARYRPLKISFEEHEGLWVLPVSFRYEHRITGHAFDGTARVKMGFAGDKARFVEVIHDTPRLHAFFELVSRMSIEA